MSDLNLKVRFIRQVMRAGRFVDDSVEVRFAYILRWTSEPVPKFVRRNVTSDAGEANFSGIAASLDSSELCARLEAPRYAKMNVPPPHVYAGGPRRELRPERIARTFRHPNAHMKLRFVLVFLPAPTSIHHLHSSAHPFS